MDTVINKVWGCQVKSAKSKVTFSAIHLCKKVIHGLYVVAYSC